MELAQDDSPVPMSTETNWQSQYWSDGYIPNETVTVKSLLEVSKSEGDHEGNGIIQRTIHSKANDIEQLRQELTDLKLAKPTNLEVKIMTPESFDENESSCDVVKVVVGFGVNFSNWVRHTLNAFRVFIPV